MFVDLSEGLSGGWTITYLTARRQPEKQEEVL